MTDDTLKWRCTRCDKPQDFIVDQPCSCGCWWLTRQENVRHVGGPTWPTLTKRAPLE